jgi:hypothetical protein
MRVAARVIGNRVPSKRLRTAASNACVGTLFRTIAIAALLLLSGCDRNPARTAAVRYLENLRQSNYAGCYAMLSDQDRSERTLAEFLTEIPLAPDVGPAWFRPVLESIQFDLGEATRDGSIAAIPVTVTAPNLPLWERTLDADAGADQSGAQNAGRSLAADDFPKITYGDVIYVIKEHHHWHVVAGLRERDRIVDQHREAIVDYHQYEFPKVAAAYQTMLANLDRLKFTGAAGLAARYRRELAAVRVVQAEVPAATAYAAKNVTLGDVAMRMSEERVPAIFGSITNTGDRALDSVQVAVTWYAGHGKSLKAAYTEKHPVVITPIEFTDFSLPVLPFVAGEKRPFGFILTVPVQIEQDAAPYVTVSAVTFTHSPAPLPRLANAKGQTAPVTNGTEAPPPAGIAVSKPTVAPAAPTLRATPSPAADLPAKKVAS